METEQSPGIGTKVIDFDTIHYIPRIKSVGFNPSPVAGKIPKWADGTNYPKVIGTQAHREFWEEQIYYCENGYHTGGLDIPGIYYDFLNFKIIDGVGGPCYPMFVDLQYDIYCAYLHVKKIGKVGIVLPKGRRKGISFISDEVIDYGLHFIDRYRFLVGAGLDTYTDGNRDKLYRTYNNKPVELRLRHLKRNDNELKMGWIENSEQGSQEYQHAHGDFKTFKDNPKKGEGEYYNDVILEEIGDFPTVVAAITSITPALKLGAIVKGTILAFGTGGNVVKGGIGMKELWHNAEALGFMRFFIPAKRYFVPFVKGVKDEKGKEIKSFINDSGNIIKCTPNIDAQFPNLKPEQLLGCEDIKAAEEEILAERFRRAKNPNKKELIEWNQHNPLTIEEVFTSSGSNNFNTDKLYQVLFNIDTKETQYGEYILDWVTDKDGNIQIPLKVKERVATPKDSEDLRVKIYLHPRTHMRDLDIGGCDSYNEDKTQVTTSLGATVVLHQNNLLKDIPDTEPGGIVPACLYFKRPKRKEIHWEISLKIAVYYNLLGNMNIAAESDACIDHFKKNGGKKYLAKRPKSFDAPDGKQMHDFGTKMTTFSKPRMLSLMQSWTEDHSQTCVFREVVEDFIAYDDENIGTDYDSADAIGLALIKISDMKAKPRKSETYQQDKRFELGDWVQGSDGGIYPADNDNRRNDPDKPWLKLEDPFEPDHLKQK